MIIELVSTGTELLLGEIINTNAPYLAKRLNELGFNVLLQTTVGDNRDRLAQVLETARSRADIVITTGGLGPTQGDITKEITAEITNRKLLLHKASEEHIRNRFAKMRRTMTSNNLRQAMIPEGALTLPNERGTAPGVVLETASATFINLPGPPHEMQRMFEKSVVPYLQQRFGTQGVITSKILRTYGITESALEEEINDYILAQKNPTLALLARNGEIIIRITANAKQIETAQILINDMEEKLCSRIGKYVYGTDNDTMELIIGKLLTNNHLSISLAESCTGGLVTSRITDIPNSSVYLKGSIICYSNDVKTDALNVSKETLRIYGAVSQETAIEMANGIRNNFGTDLGIGITGIAGPGGETATKPVGLVYVAVAGPLGNNCIEYHFAGERTRIKHLSAQAALNQLRCYILSLEGGLHCEKQ
ncbi:MAG: Competence-damaged protein [Firmicutes bacterium]|nr:Competence-damaged protein [Bacillota bacterium]